MFNINDRIESITGQPGASTSKKLTGLDALKESMLKMATAEFKSGRFAEGEAFEWRAEIVDDAIDSVLAH